MSMNKNVLISVAVVLIALAAVSTFFEFSHNVSGKFAVPVATNLYAVLTFLILTGISLFLVLRK